MISWTHLAVAGLVVLCFYSLYFYFSSTAPLLAKSRRLEAGILAIANALAKAQNDLTAQAQALHDSQSMFVQMREHCWAYEAQLAAIGENDFKRAAAERVAHVINADPAIPQPIEDEPQAHRIDVGNLAPTASLDGTRLRRLREGVGWTRKDLHRRCGLEEADIKAFECNKKVLNANVIVEIEQLLREELFKQAERTAAPDKP